MQLAYAQTQHGSLDTHSNTVTTSTSEHGHETDHSADIKHTGHNDSHNTAVQNADTHGDAHGDTHGDNHGDTHGENHGNVQSNTDSDAHGTTHGDGHGDAYGNTHGDSHGDGHGDDHAGYHAPAPFVVDVGPGTVHLNTLIMTYLVMAVLVLVTVSATRKLKRKPGKSQVFFESLVDLAHAIVKTQTHHNSYKYVPLIGTIFLFILVSNWMGLFPLRIVELFGTPKGFELAAPTNDLNTNGAIAIIAVASYWFFGIQKKGLAHFKHYFQPMPFMFPLNVMEDISRPLSLSFRLFGNILGGEIVLGILIFLTAPLIITSVVVLPIMVLKVLVGFIQAYIFSMLTMSYIGAMVADHH
ncbi:MAG: F0F1 ATP synthase subunit A [Candidatus Sericytochromatia bacterium]|nr:F0F1 ATP synthase subunit A [Candidatus Sericytochromatia bacterium]